MGIYVSDQNAVVFKYESGTYATPSGNGKWIGLVTDFTPTDEENVQQIRYTGTNNRNTGMQINTAKDYEGTIVYHPQNFRMFGFGLGSVVDSGSPSPYNHVVSELNSGSTYAYTSGTNYTTNFPSFTIVDSKRSPLGDGFHQIRNYKGCVIDSISFTVTQSEPVTSEISYRAQNLTMGSQVSDIPTIDDEDTSRPYIWSDIQFHLPSGTKIKEVTELTWSMNNNLETRHYDNGSKVADNFTPMNRDYEVSLTLDANSTWGKTLYETYWLSGAEFNTMIEAVLSTGSEQGFFVMSGCKITAFESPSPSEGINEYSVTITPESCILDTDDLIELHNPW